MKTRRSFLIKFYLMVMCVIFFFNKQWTFAKDLLYTNEGCYNRTAFIASFRKQKPSVERNSLCIHRILFARGKITSKKIQTYMIQTWSSVECGLNKRVLLLLLWFLIWYAETSDERENGKKRSACFFSNNYYSVFYITWYMLYSIFHWHVFFAVHRSEVLSAGQENEGWTG